MLEIHAEIVDIVKNDSILQGFTGYTINDERVYAWNPAEDVIYSSSKKAAIFYRTVTGKRPNKWSYPKQFANSTLFLRVVSIDQETTDKIGERLIALFDLQTVETTNWRIGSCELVNYNDALPEGTPSNTQWIKMVSFAFTNVLKRN